MPRILNGDHRFGYFAEVMFDPCDVAALGGALEAVGVVHQHLDVAGELLIFRWVGNVYHLL